LRHDLHDGVGPQLAGLALQLDSLSRRMNGDGENAARVQRLRDQLRDTVVEVRRVATDLRPPALDDLGLAETIRQQVAAYAAVGDGGSTPLVDVNCPAPLPPLPAAVEVAAYRIVTEAVANAVRHAAPSRCVVLLEAPHAHLVARVSDDGPGIDSAAPHGVGMTSMAERALEVGGHLSIETGAEGTTVTARLPRALS
jgi:signal transduction histidine kinase